MPYEHSLAFPLKQKSKVPNPDNYVDKVKTQ